MAFKPKKIIVHHSLTRDSGSVSWGAIKKYHTETKGWSDIGYHIGVELVTSGNEIYFETLMGRMWDRAGAHVRGYNNDSLGICFVGNFDTREPPEAQLQAGARILTYWRKLFDIDMIAIYPHNFFDPNKTCPGLQFDMKRLKSFIF
jgi:hypothetical protein